MQAHAIQTLKKLNTEVEAAISKAVSSQMVADVPIGAFLSGDRLFTCCSKYAKIFFSTNSNFSIGFAEEDYNEAAYAKKVASFIGTDHTDLYLSQKDVLDTVSILPTIYDEPFADVSQLPTFIVAQLASKSVKVACRAMVEMNYLVVTTGILPQKNFGQG